MIRAIFLAALLSAFAGSTCAQANQAARSPATEQRVALVIGNANYQTAPLSNPVNDATDMASALQAAGFKVILRRNASTREMRQAIRDFGAELRRNQVGLFYFAGHGVQVKGNNYLVPVGADIQSEADAEDLAIDATYVLRTMEEAQAKVSIVILDACRNSPFARSFRSASRGLGQMTAATGSLIAFATSPGAVAADGSGRNGVYTKHLLASLRESDTDILKVFQRTRAAVLKETDGKQTPWESTSLIGDFYFRAPGGGLPQLSIGQVGAATPVDPSANERTFWESVKDSKDPDELRAYLSQYPGGLFASLAQSRLRAVQTPPPVAIAEPIDKAAARRQAELGQKFAAGSGGVSKNEPEAMRLFRLAAGQGDALGQVSLAYMYENGLGGLTKDESEAARLYKLAADQGNALAQNNLGRLYWSGRGVAKDDAEAVRLYKLAVSKGEVSAQLNLAIAYGTGRGGLTKDDTEAVRLFRLAANQGNAVSQAYLGFHYATGRGVTRDDSEAARLYKLAADQGNALAQNNLGSLYANGRGVAKDEAEAARLYRLSADQGYGPAQVNLGWTYENGRGGLPRDIETAVHWYELAAKQEVPLALDSLKRLGRR